MNRAAADLTDLAALLARAYLRLAEKRRNGVVSEVENLQKRLEVGRPESPDEVANSTVEAT